MLKGSACFSYSFSKPPTQWQCKKWLLTTMNKIFFIGNGIIHMYSSLDNYSSPGFNGRHCYCLNKYVSSYNSKILKSKGEERWVGREVGRCLWLWNPCELDYCLKKEVLERSLAPSILWGNSKKCQLWTRKNTLMRMWLGRWLDIGLQFPELWEIICHCFISLLVCNNLL